MVGWIKNSMKKAAKRKTVVFDAFACSHALADGCASLGVTGGEKSTLRVGETLCARSARNCDLSGNALTGIVGASLVTTPSGSPAVSMDISDVQSVFCVRSKSSDGTLMERFLIVRKNGAASLYNGKNTASVGLITAGKDARAVLLRSVDGEERYLIVGEKGSWFLDAENIFFMTGISDLTHVMCVCKNRLFIVRKGGRLAYSSPMTPWDISESIEDGGYMDLPLHFGVPTALVAVGGYVYVFFERAVMRLEVRGSGKDFVLEEVPYCGAEIVDGSACACLDGVTFLARDGLWQVKGRTVRRFCEGLDFALNTQAQTCNAAVSEGKYFLRYWQADGTYRSLAVDLDGKHWCDCYDLIGLNGGLNAAFFMRGGQLFRVGGRELPGGEECYFESVAMDFGLRGKKTLRRLELAGEGEISLTIHCDGRLVRRNVSFADGRAFVKLDARGERFAFAFSLQSGAKLRGIRAEIVT